MRNGPPVVIEGATVYPARFNELFHIGEWKPRRLHIHCGRGVFAISPPFWLLFAAVSPLHASTRKKAKERVSVSDLPVFSCSLGVLCVLHFSSCRNACKTRRSAGQQCSPVQSSQVCVDLSPPFCFFFLFSRIFLSEVCVVGVKAAPRMFCLVWCPNCKITENRCKLGPISSSLRQAWSLG